MFRVFVGCRSGKGQWVEDFFFPSCAVVAVVRCRREGAPANEGSRGKSCEFGITLRSRWGHGEEARGIGPSCHRKEEEWNQRGDDGKAHAVGMVVC
eukprot:3999825-Pleurochrysis_carterae.AAC.1